MKVKKNNGQKKNHYLKIIFFFLILLWLILGFSRTTINLAKALNEDLISLKTSDYQKRVSTFGEEYIAFNLLESLTPEESRILVVAPDSNIMSGFFYESLYFLYPRHLTMRKNFKTIEDVSREEGFDFALVLFPKESTGGKILSSERNKLSIKKIKLFETNQLIGLILKHE